MAPVVVSVWTSPTPTSSSSPSSQGQLPCHLLLLTLGQLLLGTPFAAHTPFRARLSTVPAGLLWRAAAAAHTPPSGQPGDLVWTVAEEVALFSTVEAGAPPPTGLQGSALALAVAVTLLFLLLVHHVHLHRLEPGPRLVFSDQPGGGNPPIHLVGIAVADPDPSLLDLDHVYRSGSEGFYAVGVESKHLVPHLLVDEPHGGLSPGHLGTPAGTNRTWR